MRNNKITLRFLTTLFIVTEIVRISTVRVCGARIQSRDFHVPSI